MHAFCEKSTATPYSTLHIREMADDKSYPGGGIPNPALCGTDLLRGWDWGQAVSPDTIRAQMIPPKQVQPLCEACASAALAVPDHTGEEDSVDCAPAPTDAAPTGGLDTWDF